MTGFERIAENLTWPDREDEKKQELLAQKEEPLSHA
jgi:hypothetical protein